MKTKVTKRTTRAVPVTGKSGLTWRFALPVLRLFFLLGLGLAATVVVPSSGRASDFVKVGSPVATETQFYGIASVYDRNPKQYEAWAVGQTTGATPRGVLIYYNGSFWTRIPIPDTPPLRAVSALRYLSGSTWRTAAWAVGDDGTILRKDPNSNTSWVVQRKYVTAGEFRCAGPGGVSCPGVTSTACGLDGLGTQIACVDINGLSCSDADINSNSGLCKNWTTTDLKTVSVHNSSNAVAGGVRDGTDPKILIQHSYSSINGIGTTTWGEIANASFTTNDDVLSVQYLDGQHAWAVGHKRDTNEGRIWKYTNRTGWTNVSTAAWPATNKSNMKFNGVASMLRKTATTTDAPLTSLVWIAAEKSGSCAPNCGRIIRFDENGSANVGRDMTFPVRSIALSQRASGSTVELLTNGNFSADRQDNTGANSGRFADGWNGQSYYLSGLTPDTYVSSTALVNGEAGNGKAFVSEPWQSRSLTSGFSGSPVTVFHPSFFGEVTTTYPLEQSSWTHQGSTYTGGLNENDITPRLLRSNPINYISGFTNSYQYGTRLAGYVRIPNNTVNPQTVTFRLEHPYGRAAMFIENDVNNNTVCAGGTNPGTPCPAGTGCLGGGVCVDRSSYTTSKYYPPIATATTSWSFGSCNNTPGVSRATSCFDSNECKWGRCQNDTTIRCRTDYNPTFNVNTCESVGGPCLPFPHNVTSSCTAPPPPSESVTPAITFNAGGGIKTRACVGGTDAGKTCVTGQACAGGGSCQLVGGGWYPIYIQYYQTNTGYCSGNSMVPCGSNQECSAEGGTCISGKWCNAGSRRGASCNVNGDCPGAANACVTQYQGQECQKIVGSEPTIRSCISDYDCHPTGALIDPNNRCKIASNPAAPLKLYWNRDAAGNPIASPTQLIPATSLMTDATNSTRQSIVQEIPLSSIPGQTYQLTGRYKVEFDQSAFTGYRAVDPRQPQSGSRAGIRTKCKDSNNDNCGYDLTIFTTNQAAGVTEGTCNSNPGVRCSTNQDCVAAGAGTTCNAGWADFSAVLTKQNREATSGVKNQDDPGQSLELECFAESGAKISCDQISVKPVTDSAVTANDTVDVWAVGDNGLVARNTLNVVAALPADAWAVQLQPVTSHLRAITASDIHHLWATGDPEVGENASLVRLSPGNVAGWAWIGSASSVSGLDPIGWIDFNCGNIGSCLTQPSAFGVNVDTLPISPTFGAFSGSAWIGTTDPGETEDFGVCQNKPTGRCSLNAGMSCQDDATCASASAGTCTFTTSCSSGICTGAAGRSCTNNTQCFGACSKNQGFRCKKDSDCQVNCATNPTACNSTGWLSYDKSVTGTPPSAPFNTTYNPAIPSTFHTASLNIGTDAVTGWARLQFGRCVNVGNPSASTNKSCFLNSQCGTETCDWSAAPSKLSSTEAGWVKLRSSQNTTAIAPMQCSDCDTGGTPTSGTCGICAADLNTLIPRSVACNSCASCTLKRCTASASPWQACTEDADCGVGGGECKGYGICDDGSTDVCFSDSECSGKCIFGGQCNSCSSCQVYGVSVDYGVTKNFVGYGYSPDLGWIDFSRVSLGGQLFLQTQFGDIYAGGNIGGPTTGLPPGFPGSSPRCNATYRIVSAGTITNFCSSAQPTPPGTSLIDRTTSPFIAPGSDKFLIPSEQNRYTTTIGTIDRDGLVNVVDPAATIKRNKYGDIVETYTGDTNISAIFSCSGTGTCTPRLGAKVYHITGNLVVDKDTTFQYGISTAPNGAGTFVVDGQMIVNANIQYFTPATTAGVISERRALPSAAYLVRGEVRVSQGVSVMAGAFYGEDRILVDTGDTPLTVSGIMIAKNFDFRRRYRGLGSGSQEASELVIYDGRLQTNTPPGLSAISSSFPNVQELIP